MEDRYYIVTVWRDDASARKFIEQVRPTLLITEREDSNDRARIIRITGRTLNLEKPVFTTGHIEVYDISTMTAGGR